MATSSFDKKIVVTEKIAKNLIRKLKIQQCDFCDSDLDEKDIKDSYDDIYYICNSCYKDKRKEWEKMKEDWARIDYQYED